MPERRDDWTTPAGGVGPRPRRLAAHLALSTVVCLILVVASGFLAGMSVMVGDDPRAAHNPLVVTAVLGFFSVPVLFLAGPVIAWAAFAAGRYRSSRRAMLAPYVWMVLAYRLGFLVLSMPL